MVVGLFSLFCSMGLESTVVSRILSGGGMKSAANAWLIRLISWAVLQSLLFTVCFNLYPDNALLAIISWVTVSVFFDSFKVIELVFQAYEKTPVLAKAQCMVIFLVAVVKICLLGSEADVSAFMVLLAVEKLFFATALVIILLKDNQFNPAFKFSGNDCRLLLYRSMPMLATALLLYGYMKIDQFMVEHLLGIESLGVYSIAVRIVESIYFIPFSLSLALFPRLIKMKNELPQSVFIERIQVVYDLMAILAVLLTFFIVLVSPVVVVILGPGFEQVDNILWIYSVGIIAVFFNSLNKKIYVAENLTWLLMLRMGIGFLLNGVLNLFMIPLYGLHGAAVSTVIAYFCTAVFIHFLLNKVSYLGFIQIRAFNFLNSPQRLRRGFNGFMD